MFLVGLLLAVSCGPLVFLATSAATGGGAANATALGNALFFALGGAAVATLLGTVAGLVLGTLEFPGRRVVSALLLLPLVAPPAFWWLGLRRLPGLGVDRLHGVAAAVVIAGFALSPVPYLLVLAATREAPRSAYSAARLLLSPGRRLLSVLLPLVSSAAIGGFLLTAVLLAGESELPFLLGFRTSMTDAITDFARRFDVGAAAASAAPVVGAVLALSAIAARPLLRTLLPTALGSNLGITRHRSPPALVVPLLLSLPLVGALVGYLWQALAIAGALRPSSLVTPATAAVSVVEPVASAWLAVLVGAGAGYLVRRSFRLLRVTLTAGLVLACVPTAVCAIGWIGIGQRLGGAVPTLVVYVLRAWGLGAIAFAAAYARLPRSLENAAQLLPISSFRRAFALTLPSVAPSLVAASVLTAALVYSDRDVGSLMLPPGGERLMLDLYLRAANAPAVLVSTLALLVLCYALVSAALAAAGPWLVLRPRG